MKKKILVIGRHPEIMETVMRLINSQKGLEASGALTDEEAIARFSLEKFDLVLIGGGVDTISEQKLRTSFSEINPSTPVIQHFGGGSGLLFNEIEEALQNR